MSDVQNASVTLLDGTPMPRLGQGTWHMAEDPGRRREEIAALRLGVELGISLIDTAEMYADGGAEELVGEAIRGLDREKLFLVSKVYPHNAGRSRIFQSCENSLRRLNTETLDLYLLHWRGGVPLRETADCMHELIARGKILRFGVSNFDTADMEELWPIPGARECCVNQVLYHLGSRGVEYSLLPRMREKSVALMAYSPVAQAGALRRGLLNHPAVVSVANAHGATPAQVLIAFVLRDGNIVAIPKAGTREHVRQNAEAAGIRLTPEELDLLNRAFPPPGYKQPLDMC